MGRYAAMHAACPVVVAREENLAVHQQIAVGVRDLVILGRYQHSGTERPGIGSVQHAVLNHAHGPVAVVPFSR